MSDRQIVNRVCDSCPKPDKTAGSAEERQIANAGADLIGVTRQKFCGDTTAASDTTNCSRASTLVVYRQIID